MMQPRAPGLAIAQYDLPPLAPSNLVGLGGWPTDSFRPLSGSGVRLSVRENFVESLNGTPEFTAGRIFETLQASYDLRQRFRSMLILVDDDTDLTIRPGVSAIGCVSPGLALKLEHIEEILISAGLSRPFCCRFVFSADPEPPRFMPLTRHQERYGANAVTKTAAGGVADSWAAFNMAAAEHATQLSSATYGASFVHPRDYGETHWGLTNPSSTVPLEYRIRGLHALNNGLTNSDWLPIRDRDGNSMEELTLPPGVSREHTILGSYHYMRLSMRVPADQAAAVSVTPRVQFRAFSHGSGG